MASTAVGAPVLLVNVEAAIRRALAEILRLRGLFVEISPNGPAGLRAAIARPPNLILLDILMPGLDGGAVAQRLKADERTRAIPLVAITGVPDWLQDHDHKHVAELFEAVLFKPITGNQLIASIEKVLGR